MATLRSRYVLPTEEAFNEVKDHIYRLMYSDYSNSSSIYFYGNWGSCSKFDWERCWLIEIYDECSNPTLAANIIREHGGRFYE